jgi:hypothetical protein
MDRTDTVRVDAHSEEIARARSPYIRASELRDVQATPRMESRGCLRTAFWLEAALSV